MTASPTGSDAGYFASNYRSYTDQNPNRKLDHYIATVTNLVATERPALLDIGCGLGSFLARLSATRPLWQLYGTDLRQEAIDGSRSLLPAGVQLAVAPAEGRPFPKVQFDVITAWDVLEHLEDPISVLGLIRSMLTPGGHFVFVVPVYDGVTGPLIKWLDNDPTHLHKWPRSAWVEVVDRHLELVHWHGIYRFLFPLGSYLHVPTNRLRAATPAILGVARVTKGR